MANPVEWHAATQERWQAIQPWLTDQPLLKRRFIAQLAEKTGWSAARLEQGVEEYRRFCLLATVLGGRVVPSPDVDEVWHLHLTYTRDYWDDFCPRRLGLKLHHQPALGVEGEREALRLGYAETLHAYAALFGPPSESWWPSLRGPAPKAPWWRAAHARWLASDVKLTLLNAYPADHAVTVVTAAGSPQQRLVTLPLAELDHGDHFDHLTSVYVPPLPPHSSFTALQELVAHLRAPEGCPWDREQTLESLRGDLLDECAELLEAIDAEADGSDESAAICEELGDVLLSAVMMTQIATEEGRFQMGDAVRGIVTKLIRRHPHVFGDVSVSGVDHVLANWDVIKAQEKAEQGVTRGPLDGIPPGLPALQKARKLQSKAAKAGLLDRAALAQSEPAVAALFGGAADEARFGAVLWQVVALAHANDVDAEDALRSYAVHFRRDAV